MQELNTRSWRGIDNWFLGVAALGIVVLVACHVLGIKVPFLAERGTAPVVGGMAADGSSEYEALTHEPFSGDGGAGDAEPPPDIGPCSGR